MPFDKNPETINVGGRPKGAKSRKPSKKEVEDMFLVNTPDSVKKLKAMLNDKETNVGVKFQIAKYIIDKGLDVLVAREEEKNKGKKVQQEEVKEKPKFSAVPITNGKK